MTTTFGQDFVNHIKEEVQRTQRWVFVSTILGILAFPFVMAAAVTAQPVPEWGVGSPTIEYLNTYEGALATWAAVTAIGVGVLAIAAVIITLCEVVGDRRFNRRTALATGAAI